MGGGGSEPLSAANERFVSAVSLWEIAIKRGLGAALTLRRQAAFPPAGAFGRSTDNSAFILAKASSMIHICEA